MSSLTINSKIKTLKDNGVSGKFVNLRIANETDAEFILELRLNPDLNKFIGTTDPSVENQKKWINSSYSKETDFHFIIEDKVGNRCGTIAVYDVNYEKLEAEWGRWVIKPGSPFFCSIESNILAIHFALRLLGLKRLTGGANHLNKEVVYFHKQYVSVSSIDEKHIWFYVEDANFLKLLKRFKNFQNIEAF
jgi:RimJ/RimL family protein N-acetyltransferase